MTPRNPVLLIGVLFAAVMLPILVGIMVWVEMDTPASGPFDATFSLVDDRGRHVDQSLFKKGPALVYFGHTHCPEVCPTTLVDVAGWLKALGPRGAPLHAYFFSIDPQRDTPDVMHAYVTAISDRITGVTGKPEEMKKVVDGWMIHAAKLPGEGGEYHMSHTTSILLVGADGRLKALLPYEVDQQEALDIIRATLLKPGTV